MIKSWLIILLLLGCASGLRAREQQDRDLIPLMLSYALEQVDATGPVDRIPASLAWKSVDGQRLALGYQKQILWVQISWNVESVKLMKRVLDIGNSNTDEAELFYQKGETLERIATTGDERLFDQRSYPHRSLVFGLERLEPRDRLILRLRTTSTHNYWIRLVPESQIWREAGIEDLFYGISIGIIFIMACYNLFVFALQKNLSHLFYTLYATSYVFLVLGYKGYGFQYLWSDQPAFQKYGTGIGIHLTIVSFALFARTLFVREVDGPLRQWLKITVGVALVSFVLLMATMNQVFWKQYGIALVAAFAFWVYIRAILHVWKYPDRSLWITLGAILCLHIGGSISVLSAMGLLPYNGLTSNAMILGGNVEMTLLTFVLADRFHYALHEKARSDQALRGAVDDDLAERLKHNPQLLREDASERELTVLFLDIVNSSTTSAMFPSKDLYHRMRTTLNEVTRIIRAHRGVVNRSLGDGVLCYFGVNWDGRADTDHPTQALRAAIELQQFFLKECLDPEQTILFPVRIGLHSGRMYLGSIGDQQRVDFTLFGHEVNVAKRLENAANPFRILLSQATYGQLNPSNLPYDIHSIQIPVKNQSELLGAYECNPFIKEAQQLIQVRKRLWHYFRAEVQDERYPLRPAAMWVECRDHRFEVLNISRQGLCLAGPLYLARGVQVKLRILGDLTLQNELESTFLLPLNATICWSQPEDGRYRHGIKLYPLHPQQLQVWLQIFQPYLKDPRVLVVA